MAPAPPHPRGRLFLLRVFGRRKLSAVPRDPESEGVHGSKGRHAPYPRSARVSPRVVRLAVAANLPADPLLRLKHPRLLGRLVLRRNHLRPVKTWRRPSRPAGEVAVARPSAVTEVRVGPAATQSNLDDREETVVLVLRYCSSVI